MPLYAHPFIEKLLRTLMRAGDIVRSHPYRFFFAVLLAGILVGTLCSRALSLKPGFPPDPLDLPTERQKTLLSEEQDLSKWLLALASGALTAAVAARLSDKPTADEPAAMFAYGALIVSLFGAFLSHETRLAILRVGPLDYVYSSLFMLPTRVQFWSFTAGISALGWSLFRPRTAIMVVFLLTVTRPHLQAQTPEKPSVTLQVCITNWYSDRLNDKYADASSAMAFVAALTQKSQLANPGKTTPLTCEDLDRVFDQVRTFSVSQENRKDTSSGFTAYLQAIQPEVSGKDMTAGEAVSRFLVALDPLSSPFGVLSVRLPAGTSLPSGASYRIYIDNLLVGYVNWIGRINAAHTHNIRILSNASFKPLFQEDQYTLANGESKTIVVPVKP